MELYYNEDKTKYAVLVSTGYGVAWSHDYGKELAYDRRVIEWYLAHDSPDFWTRIYHNGSPEWIEAHNFFNDLGYDYIYFGGLHTGMLHWVPVNVFWRMNEYDGAEFIEYLNLNDWICFPS